VKNNFILLLIFLLLILFSGCANIVAPSGGAGIKTTPVVLKCSAIDGQTNYIPKSVSIEFNSYMNRGVVIENLQIAPTIRYTFKWKAKTLIMTFADELKDNTTYSISLSGKYSDYYGNTAETPFYTCFSTGDVIDSCKITGKVHTSNSDGYYIFCYIYREDIDFLKDIPDYKILVGGNGTFVVPALKDGSYIVLVVKDVDKDGRITMSRDSVGIPQFITEINNCVSKSVELIPNYLITPAPLDIDTIDFRDTTAIIDTTENYLQIDSIATIDTNIYLHFSGNVLDTNSGKDRYLVLSQAEKNISIKTKINDDDSFLFENILAGEYEIFYFIDLNGNEEFDVGSLVPFELSEPFHKIEQKVKLNTRWSVDNYIIEIK